MRAWLIAAAPALIAPTLARSEPATVETVFVTVTAQ